jgi:alpha-1,3/alpha-1,6-mannosyltransferase
LLSIGTLDVRVRGNTVVPSTILGRFSILCAILRQLHLILQIALFSSELRTLLPAVFFVDQLSAGIPLLRLLSPKSRVLFYCHFPDKLLAKKEGLLKSFYRIPFDWLESWSTGCSDGIVVNSKFTRGIFGEAFPLLKSREPRVVYPCVDSGATRSTDKETSGAYWKGEKVLLSINRFERKKDIGLAIRAFAKLPDKDRQNSRLIIAGGYDLRVTENVSYHKELCTLADSLSLKHATSKAIVTALAIPAEVKVLFLLSVPNAVKANLLASATLLIYTPRNEHLGIVPLEAMLAGIPVLAANEGGPTETVVEGQTGWLRDVSDVDAWADVMRKVVDGTIDDRTLQQMGYRGRQRVKSLFSQEKMASNLEEEISRLAKGPRPRVLGVGFGAAVGVAFVALALGLISVWRMF